MNASKEEARKAYRALTSIIETRHPMPTDAVEMLQGFLVAAERKLPTEAAYVKDKNRRKQQPA